MDGRADETHHEDERPRPVRFNIFGQMQQRRAFHTAHHMTIKTESDHSEYSNEEDRYRDDDEEDNEDQPLDFSSKKLQTEAQITASVQVTAAPQTNGHHHDNQSWMPASIHSSESGISDLCSNSPQSDGEAGPAKSPHGAVSPIPMYSHPALGNQGRQTNSSPLPSALNALYGPLAALQASRGLSSPSPAIDPAISAATTQLLSNLAAVTNGGKGGKNTRPFKAYPRDPMSLPLGLYGLPAAGNPGEETAMTQASNDAYAEFRRQMLSQVNASKAKRKSNSNSRPNSVNEDDNNCLSSLATNGSESRDIPETTIRGTVSVTDLRLVNNEDDSQHSANDSHSHSVVHMVGSKSPINCIDAMPNNNITPPTGLATTSGGSTNGSAKKRGRNGEEIKDDAYWERRRKNNEAAKRSRDARRAKEDEIAIRAAFLEQENLKLRFELANLKNETAKLRCMIYNS